MVLKKILMIIIILMIAVGFFILASGDYDMTKGYGRSQFAKDYFGWTGQVIKNVGTITGNVISMNWIPGKN